MYAKVSFLFLILVFTFLYITKFKESSFENNSYISAVKSIINDKDMNTINNVSPDMRWLVSRSYNYPDNRSNGFLGAFIPIWITLTFYGKILGIPTDDQLIIHGISLIVFIMYISIVKSYLSQISLESYIFEFILFLMGTSVAWMTFFDPENIDLVSAIVCVYLSSMFLKILRNTDHESGREDFFSFFLLQAGA